MPLSGCGAVDQENLNLQDVQIALLGHARIEEAGAADHP